jgi:hypothetical protein
MTEQHYMDEHDYRKYIIQQRALRLKRRIEKAREREDTNPYHDMYA